MPSSDELSDLKELINVRFASVGDKFASVERETARALSAIQAETANALKYSERAIEKAEMANEKRFESVNEFRGSLNDNARLLMPRSEAEQRFNTLSEKIETLSTRVNARDERRRGGEALWGYLAGAIGVLAVLWTFLKGH